MTMTRLGRAAKRSRRGSVRGRPRTVLLAAAMLACACMPWPGFGFFPWDPLWGGDRAWGWYEDDWGGPDWFGEGIWGSWMPGSRRGRHRGWGGYGYGYGDPYGYYGYGPGDYYGRPYYRDDYGPYGAEPYRYRDVPRAYGDRYRYRYGERPPWWDDYRTGPDYRRPRRRYYDDEAPPYDEPPYREDYDPYEDRRPPPDRYEAPPDRRGRMPPNGYPYGEEEPPSQDWDEEPVYPGTEREGWPSSEPNDVYAEPPPGSDVPGEGRQGDPWGSEPGPTPPPPSPW
jgi:hypothetical protein